MFSQYKLHWILCVWLCQTLGFCALVRAQFPNNGLRPLPGTTATPGTAPINSLGQTNVLPSTPPSLGQFDPYGAAPTTTNPIIGGPMVAVPNTSAFGPSGGIGAPSLNGNVLPNPNGGFAAPSVFGAPTYNGAIVPGQATNPGLGYAQPALGYAQPGYPQPGPGYAQPGVYPSTPSSLFPGAAPYQAPNLFGQPAAAGPGYAWNPQGSVFQSGIATPGFIRLFQGPRFRHAYILGNNDPDALAINDSDLSIAMAFPNFLGSNQPLYLLPSFSLHQWAGPFAPSTGDLPAVAYSAFLDAGWQTDPARILGAELGLRVGMFSDFNTANTDSLRIMGRGIGRVRLTPRATLKLGVIYLDRNRIKLLPAGGVLWQPQPNTRFDIFFPEPKFSSYLSTFGNVDTWWYIAGQYGGGAWTIQRADTSKDSIDINDIRVSLGLEFGRNNAMREGRRNAFFEVGYVFERELLFRASPMDNLNLQDSIVFRAGIGY